MPRKNPRPQAKKLREKRKKNLLPANVRPRGPRISVTNVRPGDVISMILPVSQITGSVIVDEVRRRRG